MCVFGCVGAVATASVNAMCPALYGFSGPGVSVVGESKHVGTKSKGNEKLGLVSLLSA